MPKSPDHTDRSFPPLESNPVRLQPEKVESFATKSKSPNELLLENETKQSAEEAVESTFSAPDERRRDLKHFAYAAIAISLLLVGGWMVYSSFFSSSSEQVEPIRSYVDIQNRLGQSEENEGEIVDPKLLDQAVRQVVEAFYQAKTIDKLLSICRPVPDLKQKMINHYGDQMINPEPATIVDASIESSRINQGNIFHSIRVAFQDRPSTFLVTTDYDDQLLIDWEAAVCWQPISWHELCSGQSAESYEMRCMLYLDNAFFSPFEFGKHLSLRISAPGLEENTYAFIARDSEHLSSLESAFAFWLKYPKAPLIGIFKLRFHSKASETNIFVLESMSTDSWITPE